ncbi:MAG TPA: hypothetical protein VFN22_02565 [Gemmatimonadales bacterium]|nr:hypothetical protein [Gemmatimonadales bacterium]
MPGWWRWGVMFGGLLATGLVPSAADAQAQDNPPLWRWVDARGSFCIWYLADPAIARKLLPDGLAARSVARTANLPTNLLRIAQDEPRFADWIPGLICVGQFEVVAANGAPAGHREGNRPVRFALTALAAMGAADWELLELGLDAGRLDQVGEELQIRSRERQLRLRQGLEGEDDQWSLKLEGAELGWVGHPTGPIDVGSTRMMSFGYTGDRKTAWRLDLKTSPATTQLQVGSLRIEGKGALAQALKSSPIRAVGALERGGEAVMTFTLLPDPTP